jgi:SAM-dependent methyltransferase
MSDETRRRLHAHHGGAAFHDVMINSFERRFGEEFWSFWTEHVAVSHASAPTYVDFGCGPGLMLQAWRQRWPQAELHGVELQPYMLETARKLAAEVDATVHDADLHTVRLALPDASVDAALSAVVIHEMREPVGMLGEIRRLLRPEGRLMLMDWVRVPLSQYLAEGADDLFAPDGAADVRADRIDHFMEHNKFSIEDLRWLVERAGFAVEAQHVRGDGQFVWWALRPT